VHSTLGTYEKRVFQHKFFELPDDVIWELVYCFFHQRLKLTFETQYQKLHLIFSFMLLSNFRSITVPSTNTILYTLVMMKKMEVTINSEARPVENAVVLHLLPDHVEVIKLVK